MVGRARRRPLRRDRPAARVGRLLRAGRSRRVSVVGLHDRRAGRGRRRRRDRAVHAAAGRRVDPGAGAVRGARGPVRTSSRRPEERRPSPRWPTAPSRSRGSTASWDRATRTSPRPSVRSPARWASTASPVRRSSRSSADGDVDIDMAALDLIAQAEHDPEARTFFITPDPDLVDRVAKALDEALEDAGRREIVDAALAYTKAVLVRDLEQAADVVNDLASEHLPLSAARARRVPAEGAQRGRRLPRAVVCRALRRLRRRLEPRAAHRRHGEVLERAAGVGLRHRELGGASWTSAARPAFAPGTSGDRERRGPRRATRGRWTRGRAAPRSSSREPGPRAPRRPARRRPIRLAAARRARHASTRTSVRTRCRSGFSIELAEAVRDLPLNRYPDGQMTRLREELAAHHGHPFEGTWTANGSNEVLTELLLAYGGPGRRAVVFEPTYLLHSRLSWLTHTASPSPAPCPVRAGRSGDRRDAGRRAQRRLRLLAEQPDGQRAAARCGDDARRPHRCARGRRRGLHRVRRRERAEARGRPPQRRGRADVLEGVRDGRRPPRIRADEPRRRRRPAAGAASVPHVGTRAGGRHRGPAPHRRGAVAARCDPRPARSHRRRRSRRSTA